MSNLTAEPWKLVTGTARTLVSRDKYRLKDRQLGVDLDLTYITERIIAMGLPAEGRKINVLYRNREDDVAKFLNARHAGHYMIFNLSEKRYSYGKFFGAVQEYGWPDHHAPPLNVLLDAVQAMDAWLARSPANIVAVHCKAGRGRTGTVVVSLLHYLGLCASIPQALHWFADRRSRTGEGVSLPSQVRYCHYFAHTMAHGLPARRRLVLVAVEFQPVPGMGVEGKFCPAVELSKAHAPKKPFFSTAGSDARFGEGDYTALVRCHQPLQGDICVRVSHQSVVPGAPLVLLLRAQFHTAFVPLPSYALRYSEIDGPASAPLSDSRFVSHFTLTFHFEESSPWDALPSSSSSSPRSSSPVSSSPALSALSSSSPSSPMVSSSPSPSLGGALAPLQSSPSLSSPLSPSPSLPAPSSSSSSPASRPPSCSGVSYGSALSEMKTPYHAPPVVPPHNGRATPPLPSSSSTLPPASHLMAASPTPSPPLPPRQAHDSPRAPVLHAPSHTAAVHHILAPAPAPSSAPIAPRAHSATPLAPPQTLVSPQSLMGAGESNARRHLEKRHYQQDEARLLDSPPPIDRGVKGRSLPPGASSSVRPSPLVSPSPAAQGPTPRPVSSSSSRGRASQPLSPAYLSSPAPRPPSSISAPSTHPPLVPRAASVQQLSGHAPSPSLGPAAPALPPARPSASLDEDFTSRMKNLLG